MRYAVPLILAADDRSARPMPDESVKERLVTAAFDLFHERGYDNTTVEDIAARAGTGRTTFFRTFRSKDEAIFPDHEGLLRSIHDRLAAATPETALLGVSEAARLVLLSYLNEGERARRRYTLTKLVPALRDRERAGIAQYTQLFSDFLHTWMGATQDASLRAELMANAVVTAHNHVLRRWLRGQTDRPREEFDVAIDEVLRLFAVAPTTTAEAIVIVRTDSDLGSLLPQLRALAAGDARSPNTAVVAIPQRAGAANHARPR